MKGEGIFKIKARKWEFWKPLEKIVVICNHDWKEIGRKEEIYNRGIDVHVLLKCIKCGKLERRYV